MSFLKKSISILLSLLMFASILTIVPFTAGAATTGKHKTAGTYELSFYNDGSATIESFSGYDSILEIPTTVEGYVVDAIADTAFRNCDSLQSVIIPTTVQYIGNYAFLSCDSLTNISIPYSVSYIGNSPFAGCSNLTNISVNSNNPYYVSVDGNLYSRSKSDLLQYAIGKRDSSFSIPSGVKNIKFAAFYGSDYLTSVTIPSGVTTIEDEAFEDCIKLKNISISNTVKTIGKYAFYNCTSMTNITIPSSVTDISDYALGYYLYNNLDFTINGFTIKGNSSTEAERYARANGFTFISLGKEPTENTPAKTTVTLKKSSAAVYVKGTAQIKATVKNGKGKTTYKTSNKKVAKVNSSGKVTGVKKGTATITVTNNGVSKKFKITVKNPKLNKSKLTLKKGKSFKLSIKGKVGNAKFTSSSKKVAKVNSKGKVTAKKKGKATITVKTNGMKLKCKVTVK